MAAEEENSDIATTGTARALVETAQSLSNNNTDSTQNSSIRTRSTQFADDDLSWETCAPLVSYPEKELFIEPEFVLFSAKNDYEKPQFARVTLRNNSAKNWMAFQIQSHQPVLSDDEAGTESSQSKYKWAVVEFYALPNAGLIAPNEQMEFKLILKGHFGSEWKMAKDVTVGKVALLRVRQLQVDKPDILFHGMDEKARTVRVRDLFKAINERINDDALEKFHARDIAVALPKKKSDDKVVEEDGQRA